MASISSRRAAFAMGATIALVQVILYPFSPANGFVLLAFVASAVLMIGLAILLRASFLTIVVASFLLLGFLFKAIAYLSFGADLAEPVGGFSGTARQWNMALSFAVAGLLGVAAAIFVASRFPSFVHVEPVLPLKHQLLERIMFGALILLLAVAIGLYGLNQRYMILRIGYPLGIEIDPRLYAVVSFILTWGALLGALALTQWLIDLGQLSYAAVIYVAAAIGFFASVTMGSRAQLILYLIAGLCIVAYRWARVESWQRIIVACCIAGGLFALSLLAVSIERQYAFDGSMSKVERPVPERELSDLSADPPPLAGPLGEDDPDRAPANWDPAKPAASPLPDGGIGDRLKILTDSKHLNLIIHHIRGLIIMRWVGLEGVMTIAGAERELGYDLLARALKEDPAEGSRGIYQRLAGDLYGNVKFFTFLTLPGIIGVAAYSGSLLGTFAFVFCIVLLAHSLEVFAAAMTRNVAVAAVSGVSLAYLIVQMGFPWTLLIFAIELVLATAALGLFRMLVQRLCMRAARRLNANEAD